MSPGLGKASWKYLGIALFLTGLCLVCWNLVSFVMRNAVDIPFWDEWDIAQLVIDKPTLKEVLLHQHVVHRIGAGLLIIKALAWFSNWSQVVEVYFIAFMLISTTAVVLLIKYRIDRNISPLDLVIPVLFLNIHQYQNLLWGFQISYVLPLLLLSIWVLAALAVRNRVYRNVILTVASLLSAYSSLQGLLLPLLTILFVIVELMRDKEGSKRVAAITAAMNVLIIWSYFIGFVFSLEGKPPTVLIAAAEYFASAVGTGFLVKTHNVVLNAVATVAAIVFLAIGAKKSWRDRKALNSFVGTVLTVYGLLFICLISGGRGFVGQEVQSRYITYTVLVPVGLFFIFSDLKPGRYLQAVLLAVLVINSVIYNGAIETNIGKVMSREKIALESYKNGLPSMECYNIYQLYPDRARLDSLMPAVMKFKGIPTDKLTP